MSSPASSTHSSSASSSISSDSPPPSEPSALRSSPPSSIASPISSLKCDSPKRSRPDDDNVEENPVTKKFKRAIQEVNASYTIADAAPALAGSLHDGPAVDRRTNVRRFTMTIRKRRFLAKKMGREYTRMPAAAQRGMYNPNVLCYRNSLLQSLLHLPKFVNFLFDQHPAEHCVIPIKRCLTCSLRHLASEYWAPECSSQEFMPILRRLEAQLKFLRWEGSISGEQMDADEQLSWILSTMNEQLPGSSVASMQAITQLNLDSRIVCHHCHNVSATESDERSLSIPLKPRIPNGSLSKYLGKYMNEIVEGYRCEKCKKQGNFRRSQVIRHAPDILFVQLKRFDYDGTKDKLRLPIDLTLDLNPYRDSSNKECMQYELMASISHSGSLDWGHYVCDARGPDGVWKCYNDERVSNTTVQKALEKLPYLLFYQRKQSI